MQSSTSLPGARIGKYRILAHVATGGMGSVYKARDEQLGRIVALKVLAPELASNPILVERFKREARHAARLTHKNIVTLFESDESEGTHYLAMEYIEGVDLAEYIRRKGQLEAEEARRILIQACKALEHAFAIGITHRDIKPSNFLLANEEGRCRVKLTDLGLSRMTNEEDFRVTRAGTTVGTVDYMAPEQARDASLADIRSDIYSLGCTLYHMLAGQPPFAEGGIGERVYKHLAADPPDIRTFNENVPAGLWTVVRRMLAKHPDDRFQTPGEVIEALRSLADPVTPSRMLNDQEQESTETTPVQLRPLTPVPEPIEPATPQSAPRVTPVSMPTVDPGSAPKVPVQNTPSTRQVPTLRQPAPKKERPSDPPRPIEPVRSPEPVRRKPATTIPEMNHTVSDPPEALGITPEQRHAANGQFTHATEVIRTEGDANYAIQLLLSCCKLDPINFLYRKMLREVVRDQGAAKKGWFGSLTNLPARGRLRSARKAGEHRKVLEIGEELLTKLPGDVATQLEMAEAALELNLLGLAVWLLEEAAAGAPKDPPVMRALAGVYETQKRYKHAIAQWEKVRDLDPSDSEPREKIRELSVKETLSRGSYKR